MKKLAVVLGVIVGIYLIGINIMKNIRLSKNFVLGEFMKSDTARMLDIPNIPTKEEIENVQYLVDNFLQPLRDHLGKRITITSGGRVKKLNKAVGGSATSEHQHWRAADFKVKGMSNADIIRAAKYLGLPFDQLIDESLYKKGLTNPVEWVHVGLKKEGNRYEHKLARNTKTNLKVQYSLA